MLTNVDVFGVQSIPQLSLPLAGADEPIQIKDIDGLGPVKATIASSLYGVVPGEAVTGTTVGKRNIVLTLGLNPDWETQTIEELRKLLYRYFMPTLPVTLRFTSTHLPTCQIDGVVEDMPPNIFSKDPEIQVSVICPRPEFTALEKTTLTGRVTIDADDPVEIEYVGSVDTGVNVLIKPSDTRGTYTGPISISTKQIIEKKITLDPVTVDGTQDFELNSVPGSKYAHVPGENPVSLLAAVQRGYSWPALKPGLNQFAVVADLDGQFWTLSYLAKFGGL